jgi:CDP-diacylglycerol--glycerol-3-phosphate 3-phosphatidyltransferase
MVNFAIMLTWLRILLVPVFAGVLLLDIPEKQWIAVVVFFFAALTDALDGYIARKFNQATEFGATLDPVADKLLVATALIFLIGEGVPIWMAWVLIIRDFSIVGLRLAVKRKSVIRPSFMGKLKTVFEMLGIVLVLLQVKVAASVLFIAVILSVVSGIEYVWQFRRSLK